MSRNSIPRVQGIGSGLIARDLNLRAQMALEGLTDDPVADIVALLRSDQLIDQKSRKKLADAFERKSRGVNLKLGKPAKTKFLKQILRDVARVRHGRHARGSSDSMSYKAAVAALAAKMRKSQKTAESCVTLANSVDKWIADVRSKMPQHADLTDFELEIAFHSAKAEASTPENAIDDLLKPLAGLIKMIEQFQDKALRHDEWFVT